MRAWLLIPIPIRVWGLGCPSSSPEQEKVCEVHAKFRASSRMTMKKGMRLGSGTGSR